MLSRGLMGVWLCCVALSAAGLNSAAANPPPRIAISHTYEVRIRLDGTVSTVRVQARDAGHAKKLVQAQYGPQVTVLSTKRID